MKYVKIQKFADGGMVEDLDSLKEGWDSRQAQKLLTVNPDNPFGYTKKPKPWETPATNPELQQPPTTPQGNLMQMPTPEMPLGVQQQIQGVNQAAQAQADFGNQEAQLLQQKELQMQEIAQRQTQLHDEYRNEVRAITTDIQNGMIDPNRYVNSMTTTGKVGTAIGLLVGGFGAGIAGQENMALKYLNSQIENDVKAQMANQQSKQNLYSFAMQNFKNENDAISATKAIYADMYANKIEQAAAKLKDPTAKANALVQAGKLREPYDAQLNQIAQRQALMQAAGSPNALPQTKDRAISQLISSQPESRQKELLEAKEVYDNTKSAIEAIDKTFNAVKDIGPVAANLPFSQTRASLKTEHAKIESAIRATMKGQGTIQESEIERLVNPFLPQGTDTPAQQQVKQQKLKELLVQKNMGSMKRLSNIGIPVEDLTPKNDKVDIKK